MSFLSMSYASDGEEYMVSIWHHGWLGVSQKLDDKLF